MNRKKVSTELHYSIIIALIISIITSFLFGMLLVEVLFGGGLRYFAELSTGRQIVNQLSVSRTYAFDEKYQEDLPAYINEAYRRGYERGAIVAENLQARANKYLSTEEKLNVPLISNTDVSLVLRNISASVESVDIQSLYNAFQLGYLKSLLTGSTASLPMASYDIPFVQNGFSANVIAHSPYGLQGETTSLESGVTGGGGSTSLSCCGICFPPTECNPATCRCEQRTSQCQSDRDCDPGSYCNNYGACESCNCFSDGECNEGFYCSSNGSRACSCRIKPIFNPPTDPDPYPDRGCNWGGVFKPTSWYCKVCNKDVSFSVDADIDLKKKSCTVKFEVSIGQ